MQFTYANLYVNNVRRSLDFYQQAFGFETHLLHESGDWGELDTGTTRLCFSSHQLMAQLGKATSRANPKAPSFEVAFTTDDVPHAVEKAIAAGAKLIQAPEQMSWGQVVAYVADLDGILVELCTLVDSQSL